MNRRPFLVVLALLVVALVITAIGLQVGSVWTGLAGNGDAPASVSAGAASSSPAAAVGSVAPSGPGANASAVPGASATPSPGAGHSASPGVVAGSVPIVPVTNFRGAGTSTTRSEVASVLTGTSSSYQALELVANEADAILAALDLARPPEADRLVLADDAAALAADLTKNGKRRLPW